MKNFLICLCIVIAMFACSLSTNAMMKYEEALNLSKPVAILVYADWADDAQQAQDIFSALEQTRGDKYNFVALNIADKDTKLFNQTHHIYPKLPYVLLFKDKGKFSRYVQKDCLMNNSCITEKMGFFSN